jgi:hypothetical protein
MAVYTVKLNFTFTFSCLSENISNLLFAGLLREEVRVAFALG